MSSTQYSTPTKLIHWLTAILVLVAFIYGPGGSEARVYSALRDSDRQLHETLGLCVLALSVIRLLWRAVDKRPPPVDGALWMRRLASVVQIVLFALLFIVPLTAISGAWLEGHPLTLVQSVTIAPPIAPSHDLGATIAELHGWLGDIILWVAGLHAAAALFHHYVLRDDVLRRMLPHRH